MQQPAGPIEIRGLFSPKRERERECRDPGVTVERERERDLLGTREGEREREIY
jgi:hypothetical protein